MDIPLFFSAVFTKGNNKIDFLFGLLDRTAKYFKCDSFLFKHFLLKDQNLPFQAGGKLNLFKLFSPGSAVNSRDFKVEVHPKLLIFQIKFSGPRTFILRNQ